ncbi:hypothetical protein CEXT_288451 [Caerostris extrusa]|uniref:Uncharacterized protein n=1 Tax=Caerostris extrusa TaxID=172846 RepID=A0AAV4VF24_CAEEX|nr:hypothetical protein CEXT_288451 [Caerostris extrusa]
MSPYVLVGRKIPPRCTRRYRARSAAKAGVKLIGRGALMGMEIASWNRQSCLMANWLTVSQALVGSESRTSHWRGSYNKRNCGRVLIGVEEVWGYKASEELLSLRLRWYHCSGRSGKQLSHIQG